MDILALLANYYQITNIYVDFWDSMYACTAGAQGPDLLPHASDVLDSLLVGLVAPLIGSL